MRKILLYQIRLSKEYHQVTNKTKCSIRNTWTFIPVKPLIADFFLRNLIVPRFQLSQLINVQNQFQLYESIEY